MATAPSLDRDIAATLANRASLARNANLVYWYDRLYRRILGSEPEWRDKVILEIGSGASPLKRIVPQVMTSDVMPLDYLDHVFDCHDIDRYAGIADRSVDLVIMTNVLHHLSDPLRFLRNLRAKLHAGSEVVMVEPYFSTLSYPIYKLLHHEPVNFDVEAPLLHDIAGPLSTANQAIPYMIFFLRPDWLAALGESYDLSATRLEFYTALSYMLSGGVSRRFPVPQALYRRAYRLDAWLARRMPRLLASFFIARLAAR